MNPYAPKPGLLGLLVPQLAGNDVYQGLRPVLNDIGAGLTQGNSWSSGLAGAGQMLARNAPIRAEQQANAANWSTEQQAKETTARNIMNMGYQDVADAVMSGAVDPKSGMNLAFQRKMTTQQEEAQAKANAANAQFLKDPTLKQLVAAGAMDVKEAYKLENPTASGGDWGTAIVPGVDANGNMIPMRASPGGGLAQAQMPPGVRYAPAELAATKTGATVDAKTAAAARAALPGAQQAREVTDKAMAEIRANADGMKEWFSQAGIAPRGMYVQGGTNMAKFQGAAKNASAQAFMQARAMLKGGGQITDYEGRRAEDAYSRMQSAMDSGDEQQYLRAIADFEDAVITGYNKLVATAQGDYSAGGAGITGGYGGTDYKSKYGLE